MAKKGKTRRERAAAAAQRAAPRPARETAPRPAKAEEKARTPLGRTLVRHVLWFLPFYAGLVAAAYLLRTFYAHNFQPPALMMGALAAAAVGILGEYPWLRFVQRWETRGPAPGEPRKGPAESRP